MVLTGAGCEGTLTTLIAEVNFNSRSQKQIKSVIETVSLLVYLNQGYGIHSYSQARFSILLSGNLLRQGNRVRIYIYLVRQKT